MRVGLISSLHRGGPVESATVLARGLVERGHSVRAVAATTEIAERMSSGGARAAVLPLRRSLDWRHASCIASFLRGCDVVHAQDRRSGLWMRLLPKPRRDCLRVYTVHGLPDQYLPPPAGPAEPGLRAAVAYRGLDAGLCRRVDVVITPSRAVETFLCRRLGFPADKLTVVPNGVTVPAGQTVARGDRIGTVSVLEPVKGLDVFIEAAARVSAERRGARFAIFGEGSQRARLASRMRALRLEDRVELLGHRPADQALSTLRVFVLCSYMESSPMGLLEAMAAGVPAVATRVGGVPEICVDGTAILVEPGDPDGLARGVLDLLDDSPQRRAQIEAARRLVREGYSAQRFVERTVETYDRFRRVCSTG
jgi:glycosyltransferase involved in cell wall biosynthesis